MFYFEHDFWNSEFLENIYFTGYINFLVADGLKFTHPLHHLGKSADDLPVLAIDSFKHMYVWRHDVKDNLEWDFLN